ncbi:hypothetical protein BC830DRAFT_477886 [Chytriomyces sp. MP71]|nr:hypothetical protein BC830DRAFT_477886 [Chytriomyces sp. MP71]
MYDESFFLQEAGSIFWLTFGVTSRNIVVKMVLSEQPPQQLIYPTASLAEEAGQDIDVNMPQKDGHLGAETATKWGGTGEVSPGEPMVWQYLQALEDNAALFREHSSVLAAQLDVETRTRMAEAELFGARAAISRLKAQIGAVKAKAKAPMVSPPLRLHLAASSRASDTGTGTGPGRAPPKPGTAPPMTRKRSSPSSLVSLPTHAGAGEPSQKRRDSKLDSFPMPPTYTSSCGFQFKHPAPATLEDGRPNTQGYRSWCEVVKAGLPGYIKAGYHKRIMLAYHEEKGLPEVIVKNGSRPVNAIAEEEYASFVEYMKSQLVKGSWKMGLGGGSDSGVKVRLLAGKLTMPRGEVGGDEGSTGDVEVGVPEAPTAAPRDDMTMAESDSGIASVRSYHLADSSTIVETETRGVLQDA